jgi:hypothetical protein
MKGGELMMVLSLRNIIVMTVLAASAVFITTSALAAPGNSGETKPGWGNGDKNHVHTGPPGQTVRP